MRALYWPSLKLEESYNLSGDSLHHLVNVVRIEKGDELLLLSGNGLRVKTQAMEVSKKNVILNALSHDEQELPFRMDLALGMPKRDALELSLKQAVELGFGTIYIVRSEYSQMKLPEEERVLKLLISALEQSNACYLPKVIETKWDKIPYSTYKEALLFDSRPNTVSNSISNEVDHILVIGPEGGFSSSEHAFFHELSNLKTISLPTPILRTPTAIAAGAGIVIRGLLK